MELSFRADESARPKREAELLAAATRVFYERGYVDASVQDVADELGLLKGSLYHYIRTKEDLLYRVLEQVHGEVQQILDEVAAVPDLPPLERIRLYIKRQVLYTLDNLERNKVYYHDMAHLGEARRAEIFARRADHSRFIRGLVLEAQARGEVDPDLDPSLTGNCIFAAIIWTHSWYRPDGRTSRQEIASVCARYAISGLVGFALEA